MCTPTFIFDLDGVVVDTQKHHEATWKELCRSIGYELTDDNCEDLKGVNREMSIEKIINWSNVKLSKSEIEIAINRKTTSFINIISNLNQISLIDGVHEFITDAKREKHPIGLYSSSRNARYILDKLSMTDLFDAIVDGNDVVRSKPDPEGFLLVSKLTKTAPENCVVFEDSKAGLQAAKKINMKAIGIGNENVSGLADQFYNDFNGISLKLFC